MPRYAIYFAPDAAGALWRYGCGVLGIDAATGTDVPYATTAGVTRDAWTSLTAEPRRYGFHATLKAPFELAAGIDPDALLAATASLAASLAAIAVPRLVVAEIGRFVALVPSEPAPRLHAIADACVLRLDHLRAPLGERDRARRLASQLTDRQIARLDAHGYPYVLDEFRFHMTLTGPIADAARRADVRAALAAHYAAAVPAGPLAVDRIAVFRQPQRDSPFRILATFPLSAPPAA